MKQCTNCGNSANDNDVVCGFCGQRLDSSPIGDTTGSGDGSTDYNMNSTINSDPYYQSNTPVQPKTNGYAIASLVLGIVSIPLLCCCVGFITAILAVIFGFIARNKIARSNGSETGNGLALAGIITGFAVIGISILLLIISITTSPSGNFWEYFGKNFPEELRRQLEQQSKYQ